MRGMAALLFLLLAAPAFAEEAKPAACERVKGVKIPAADRPDAAAEKALLGSRSVSGPARTPGCDAEALYYGIGVPADPVKARHCAILEMDPRWDVETVFGGKTALMMIYANGKGVPRNYDLAIRFACETSWAPAELEERVRHLEEMRAKGDKAPTDFDVCDDITSGYMMGHCAAHRERMAAAKRAAETKSMLARWSAAERDAFKALRAKTDAWIEARSLEEVDLSGTGRGAFVVEERDAQEASFRELLGLLEKGAPKLAGEGASELAKADAELNEVYRGVMGIRDFEWGTVKQEGIRTAERAWIAYRDAWVAFTKKKYPKASPERVAAWLTRERTEMLREFLPDSR